MIANRERLIFGLHIAVLIAAVALIFMISLDTFRNISFDSDALYLRAQFYICLFLMAELAVEFALSPRKVRFACTHAIFFLLSIPYLNIFKYYGIATSGEMHYVLRVIPMLRAAYVLLSVTTQLTGNRLRSMVTTYVALLIVVVYFSSMMFYVEEHSINADVHSYGDALWWAVMCMTTAGSYIGEMSLTGKILSVVLSGGGLILFPVFTVYITDAVTHRKSTRG